jgi:HK97 gp10 family phage protein
MAGEVTIKISGLDDLKATLRGLPAKLRRKALRNALAAGARVVRDVARQAAPIISAADPMVQKGWRKPGTLRNAISVRTSKAAQRNGDVGVFVNVRPAKGAVYRTSTRVVKGAKVRQRTMARASQRGAKSPNDPYYWRFVEFGTRRARPIPFLRVAVKSLTQALEVFKARIGTQLARLNATPKADLQ